MASWLHPRFLLVLTLALLAGILRVISLTYELEPFASYTIVGALAIFGGAYFRPRWKALTFPLIILLVSDLVLAFGIYSPWRKGILYDGWWITYASFLFIVILSGKINKTISPLRFLSSSFVAALLHFLITNFFVWLGGGLNIITKLPYTPDIQGLLACYTLGLPFFKTMLIANVVYGSVLFSSMELSRSFIPKKWFNHPKTT